MQVGRVKREWSGPIYHLGPLEVRGALQGVGTNGVTMIFELGREWSGLGGNEVRGLFHVLVGNHSGPWEPTPCSLPASEDI